MYGEGVMSKKKKLRPGHLVKKRQGKRESSYRYRQRRPKPKEVASVHGSVMLVRTPGPTRKVDHCDVVDCDDYEAI